jgi:hypothetical protein
MNIKLTTALQVAGLREGDTIKRFPSKGEPQATFDENSKKLIDVFEIKGINKSNNMMSLVMSGTSQAMFSNPGDVGRLFISAGDVVDQQLWWQ